MRQVPIARRSIYIYGLRIQSADVDGNWKQYTSPLTNSKYYYNAEHKLVTTADIRNINLHALLEQYNCIQAAKGNEIFMEQSHDNHWFMLELDHEEQSGRVISNSSIGQHYKGLVRHFLAIAHIQRQPKTLQMTSNQTIGPIYTTIHVITNSRAQQTQTPWKYCN